MAKIYTIGVAGGAGSGKSLIVNSIVKNFEDDIAVLRLDNYYREMHDLSFEERCKQNFDTPEVFEWDLLLEHVKKLQNWESIQTPVYDFFNFDRTDKTVEIAPNKILIIEGIHTLVNKDLVDLIDLKIFVDVDADERILRRMTRDVEERGRTIESVKTQYLTSVKPMHEKYVQPSKANANIIIPEGGLNKIAIEVIQDYISVFLKNN